MTLQGQRTTIVGRTQASTDLLQDGNISGQRLQIRIDTSYNS
jgi:hypothetical protein